MSKKTNWANFLENHNSKTRLYTNIGYLFCNRQHVINLSLDNFKFEFICHLGKCPDCNFKGQIKGAVAQTNSSIVINIQ